MVLIFILKHQDMLDRIRLVEEITPIACHTAYLPSRDTQVSVFVQFKKIIRILGIHLIQPPISSAFYAKRRITDHSVHKGRPVGLETQTGPFFKNSILPSYRIMRIERKLFSILNESIHVIITR